jgi:hypothetical protein
VPTLSQSGEVVLALCNHTITEALEHSTLRIAMCMLEFSGKRGQKVVEEEEDAENADDNE